MHANDVAVFKLSSGPNPEMWKLSKWAGVFITGPGSTDIRATVTLIFTTLTIKAFKPSLPGPARRGSDMSSIRPYRLRQAGPVVGQCAGASRNERGDRRFPFDAADIPDSWCDSLTALMDNPAVVAIGEDSGVDANQPLSRSRAANRRL